MQTTLEQLKQWLDGAEVHNDSGLAGVAIHGATTDSRAVVPGNLFIALHGERFDAHDFLDQAVAIHITAAQIDLQLAATRKHFDG